VLDAVVEVALVVLTLVGTAANVFAIVVTAVTPVSSGTPKVGLIELLVEAVPVDNSTCVGIAAGFDLSKLRLNRTCCV
jgi:hypothetical protein